MSKPGRQSRSTGPDQPVSRFSVEAGAGLIGSLLLDLTTLVLVAGQGSEPPRSAWLAGLAAVVMGLVVAAVLSWRFKITGVVLGAAIGSAVSVGIAGLLIWFVHASNANAVFGGAK